LNQKVNSGQTVAESSATKSSQIVAESWIHDPSIFIDLLLLQLTCSSTYTTAAKKMLKHEKGFHENCDACRVAKNVQAQQAIWTILGNGVL
jgi:hypothetical protein